MHNSVDFSDPVEFQMSFDRRTGKPIAVSVIKLERGTVSFEILNEASVCGNIVAEAKHVIKPKGVGLTPDH